MTLTHRQLYDNYTTGIINIKRTDGVVYVSIEMIDGNWACGDSPDPEQAEWNAFNDLYNQITNNENNTL